MSTTIDRTTRAVELLSDLRRRGGNIFFVWEGVVRVEPRSVRTLADKLQLSSLNAELVSLLGVDMFPERAELPSWLQQWLDRRTAYQEQVFLHTVRLWTRTTGYTFETCALRMHEICRGRWTSGEPG